MSFQAYLDTIEKKTGLTPRALVEIAETKGFAGPEVKGGEVITVLKEYYDIGRGHAMEIVHVINNGTKIERKHVGTTGTHRDESDTLWLDGIASKP